MLGLDQQSWCTFYYWVRCKKWNLHFGPLGPEKRPKRPDSGHRREKPNRWLRRHRNFARSTPWNRPDWWKTARYSPFFAENQFSPADEFVLMGLVVRKCHFDVTACAEARRLAQCWISNKSSKHIYIYLRAPLSGVNIIKHVVACFLTRTSVSHRGSGVNNYSVPVLIAMWIISTLDRVFQICTFSTNSSTHWGMMIFNLKRKPIMHTKILPFVIRT